MVAAALTTPASSINICVSNITPLLFSVASDLSREMVNDLLTSALAGAIGDHAFGSGMPGS